MKTFSYQHDGKFCTVSAVDDAAAARLTPLGATVVNSTTCAADPNCDFFDSWGIVDGVIVMDLRKASETRLEQIRFARNERLKGLDTQQMIAIGRGDNVKFAEVEAMKQKLRDLPTTLNFNNVKNAYDIKHIVPPEIV